jgi:hypothetical protein
LARKTDRLIERLLGSRIVAGLLSVHRSLQFAPIRAKHIVLRNCRLREPPVLGYVQKAASLSIRDSTFFACAGSRRVC